MDKIESKLADADMPRQLYMCSNLKTIWAIEVHLRWSQCLWKSRIKKLWANMAYILEEIDYQDKDAILSSQYNTNSLKISYVVVVQMAWE